MQKLKVITIFISFKNTDYDFDVNDFLNILIMQGQNCINQSMGNLKGKIMIHYNIIR